MTVPLCRRRFTVDEYHRMGETGVLTESDRVELIDGELLEMSPIGRNHAAVVDRVNRLLVTGLGDAAIVRVQNPIVLGPHSEPQPDLALLRPRDDFYAAGHPTPHDIWLVIEVGETSVAYDRQVKLPRYAQAAIPEVWLIDLAAGQVQVYRQPAAGTYRQVRTVGRGQSLPLAIPRQLSIPVVDLLGS